jgi:methylmalonyl-CoA mutase
MTINGPAPMLLAFFLNAAIDQGCEKYIHAQGWSKRSRRRSTRLRERGLRAAPAYYRPAAGRQRRPGPAAAGRPGGEVLPPRSTPASRPRRWPRARHGAGRHPQGGPGPEHLHLLDRVRAAHDGRHPAVLHRQQGVRNFYSVSISGYHIAEAGANPITQLALHAGERLHLRRVLPLARDAHRRLRAEPVVLLLERHGPRVLGARPRRAPHLGAAMRHKYGGNERSQKLKYHIQTSGRSLHAQEIAFNDIRTTLQALYAIYDNCNSLHTNAYDEAITTPTEESVRRAMAIQLIINRSSAWRRTRTRCRARSSSTSSPTWSKRPCCRVLARSASAAACWAPWSACTSARRSRRSRCTTSR